MATDEARPRPSGRATARLAAGVGGEVADLRTRLRTALDEADRLEADGRPDLAVEVLEEQRAVLADVHRRLERHVADAAVEREAEAVVADVPTDIPVPAPAHGADDPSSAPRRERPQVLVGRLVASAAAAVVGLALLVSSEAGTGGLTMAGRTTEAASEAPEDGRASATAGAEAHAPDDQAARGGASEDGPRGGQETVGREVTASTVNPVDAVGRPTGDDNGTTDTTAPPTLQELLTGIGEAGAVVDDVADERGADQRDWDGRGWDRREWGERGRWSADGSADEDGLAGWSDEG